MNTFLSLPLSVRMLLLGLLGLLLGGFLNWCIYSLAYFPRPISPWSRPPAGVARRSWGDCLPILGWLRLRRESAIHGNSFWIRPMLIELGTAAAFALLYFWEVQGNLLTPELLITANLTELQSVFHQQYLAHIVLICLMIVATFIDVDEKTIPDLITIPGTLLALTLAVVMPWSLLPDEILVQIPGTEQFDPTPVLGFLRFVSSVEWPVKFNTEFGLYLGLACFWLWCIGMLPRPWRTRHGYGRAVQILFARIAREPFSLLILAIGVIGSLAIGWVWGSLAGDSWEALLSALVGMAAGGGMIWMVRVIGKLTLKREAMGFGDVTLMAMIGAFLGWQACLIIFFLAPFAALVIGLTQWCLRGDNLIPYGPFLCIGTLVVLVFWSPIWAWALPLFASGWLVPGAMLGCLALMGGLLFLIRFVSDNVFGSER